MRVYFFFKAVQLLMAVMITYQFVSVCKFCKCDIAASTGDEASSTTATTTVSGSEVVIATATAPTTNAEKKAAHEHRRRKREEPTTTTSEGSSSSSSSSTTTTTTTTTAPGNARELPTDPTVAPLPADEETREAAVSPAAVLVAANNSASDEIEIGAAIVESTTTTTTVEAAVASSTTTETASADSTTTASSTAAVEKNATTTNLNGFVYLEDAVTAGNVSSTSTAVWNVPLLSAKAVCTEVPSNWYIGMAYHLPTSNISLHGLTFPTLIVTIAWHLLSLISGIDKKTTSSWRHAIVRGVLQLLLWLLACLLIKHTNDNWSLVWSHANFSPDFPQEWLCCMALTVVMILMTMAEMAGKEVLEANVVLEPTAESYDVLNYEVEACNNNGSVQHLGTSLERVNENGTYRALDSPAVASYRPKTSAARASNNMAVRFDNLDHY